VFDPAQTTQRPPQVNVVVMRGVNDDEVCDFVEMTRDAPINVR
jgi:cyclic pyranopterin phosphate synthase